MIALAAAALLILIAGLVLTLRTGRFSMTLKKEQDEPPAKSVQAHPYLLNPVFLVYTGAGLLLAVLILYFAFSYGY
ncbi:hypothetical protein GKZ89_06730 [Bacillus mangrovi]|uniref:Uncharacterized protein n=1 Tax=Metabacillus mangrovi TaxID=1491830 RepID=A0A7X2S3M6_9BACI|nr:hypothetical protein [Metabacillus mangrovi]MTH53103.1 hypothetical protein [Metabacillus mangrovi]